jgi:sugar phosphate isomerase/epimerase
MKKAVQQMMIGPLCKKYEDTLKILKELKEIGYDAIELNSYMIHKTPFLVRMLTKAAGMPSGNAGKLDWHKLINESGLEVASLHTDLGSLERKAEKIINEAKSFNTKYLVITGMYRFDYSNKNELENLAKRLNEVGKKVTESGLMLLYHNHNVEFKRLDDGQLVYDYLIQNLEEKYVNFELDTYWVAEAGVNVYSLSKTLGKREKLHHINDRGSKDKGPYMTPILKSDSMELGTGTMDLETLLKIDKENNVDYVILETHKNFIDNSRMKSIRISGDYLNKHL